MQRIDGRLIYSASDLNDFLDCARLSELERAVAMGEGERPERSAQALLIAEKGLEHEQRHLELLKRRHRDVVTIEEPVRGSLAAIERAAEETHQAMKGGAAIIYQGVFFDGTWLGKSDFLLRVDEPSQHWPWSYEVADTKLALSTKPYFIVQLSFYSAQLARVQGSSPAWMHVILGDGRQERYRVDEFAAYVRRLKRRFEADAAGAAESYPWPNDHCNICPWNAVCEARRESDDHLTLVARIRRDQIKKLQTNGIQTVGALAAASESERPPSMAGATFVTLHRQARLQRRQSEAFAAGDAHAGPRHFYELLDPAERSGFGLLPEPAAGDVFFDMEGDPLFRPGRGLEYLFGVYAHGDARPFRSFWAHGFVEERRAFEQFIDWVTARRADYPAMHVYHFAPYEKTALRRLASQYATRENELDALLRAEVFVDLFAVVRRAVRVSQPSYSLKKLEAFYDMRRTTETKYGGDSIVMYEQWIRQPDRREILDDIERYNQDDCRSTWMLRDWLLGLRAEAIAAYGVDIPFRPSKAEKAESATALDGERDEMRIALLQGLEDEDFDTIATRSDADRARWTLAHLLDYHRREENPVWWAFFDRQEQCDDFVHGDRESIGGLQLAAGVDPVRADRSAIYTYEFPEQQYKLKAGTVYDPETGRTAGTLLGIDDDANRLQLKRTGSPADAAAIRALIPPGPVVAGAQKASLVRTAQSLCAGTLERDHPVILDLLLRRAPRVNGFERGAILQPEVVDAESLANLIGALDRSYLFVQGPPGTGKTTAGAAAVVALLAAGKRVGIVANAYAAIANFLTKVERCAAERGVRFRGLQKFSDPDDAYVSPLDDPFVRATKDPAPFAASDWQLAAGNAWLFARPEMENALDVLVVDEAGQCALADALSVAPAARNMVLLGDPMQLAQVSIGTHPGRLGISVLEHLLGDGARTVAPDRGIFLNRSYRMRPEICEFISTRVYDGRLQWDPLTERQHVDGAAAALNAVPIEHAGNAEQSAEETDEIVRRIQSLLGTTFVDSHGVARPLSDADILVVTPYNAQRRRIARALQERDIHVAVGTVDKFQGQEAVAVFFSMATSSRDELRSGGFLFSINRFNVALSRARALAYVVHSPRLLDVRCSSVEEMRRVNVLCDFVETANAGADFGSPARTSEPCATRDPTGPMASAY